MARYSGSSGKHWNVYFDDSMVEDGYGYTIYWTAGMQATDYYSYETNYNKLSWSWSPGGGGSTTKSVSLAANGSVALANGSYYIAKTQSTQYPSLSFTLDRTASGWQAGTASVSNVYNIAPLASHTVSFDANGGSGAPGNQTKWYGTVLALSSTEPTRANYSFLGWSTSMDATSPEYSAGGSYSADADAKLYAVWHLDYVAPKISSVTALRSGDTEGTANPLGGYGFVSCTFAKGTNDVTEVTVSDALKKTWTISGTTSGASGTFTAYTSLPATEETDVTVSVTDGSGTTSQTRHIGTSTPPIDVGLKGTAVGILASATNAGLTLPGTRYCLGHQELPVLYYTSNPDEGSVPCKPCLVVVKGGATYLYE